MGDDFASMNEMIATLKELGGSGMTDKVAAKAAPLVDEAIKTTAKAGQNPYGEPWAPKKDGGAPLKNAASHVSTRSSGSLVIVTLTGEAEVFHNRGGKRTPQRQIIPNSETFLPRTVNDALVTAAGKLFDEITGR
jgi:hypothetical protein